MQAATRLLLPFTEEISAQSLNYAVQLARQQRAMLILLALIPVKPGKGPRLESIQQAQDFLVMARRKAERNGIEVLSSQIYTQDAARSIEAFAGEMNCEAVILFLSNTSRALLGQDEIRELMNRTACNMHIVLLSEKRRRHGLPYPLHIPLSRQAYEGIDEPEADSFLAEQGTDETPRLFYDPSPG